MEGVYQQLARHLDTLPISFPETPEKIELKILKQWFSPEEARIALHMNGYPETVEVIAKKAGIPSQELASKLKKMSKKGLIFSGTQKEAPFYMLVPFAEGMWEFHINTLDKGDPQTLNEYVEYFMNHTWYATPTSQHRIIPVAKSLSSEIEVYAYDQAEAIIRSQSKISVADCVCRKQKAIIEGRACGHPMEVCMAFGTGAHYYIENGWGREISTKEALDILDMARDAGLVLQPGIGKKVWSLCMCCACCCHLLKSLAGMEKPAGVAHTSFHAVINGDTCTACSACEDCCPMSAVKIEGVARIDPDRCIGCGVCVGACAFDSIALRPKNDPYVPPSDMVHMHRRIAKEREGAGKVK